MNTIFEILKNSIECKDDNYIIEPKSVIVRIKLKYEDDMIVSLKKNKEKKH